MAESLKFFRRLLAIREQVILVRGNLGVGGLQHSSSVPRLGQRAHILGGWKRKRIYTCTVHERARTRPCEPPAHVRTTLTGIDPPPILLFEAPGDALERRELQKRVRTHLSTETGLEAMFPGGGADGPARSARQTQWPYSRRPVASKILMISCTSAISARRR